jgi:hypothetical protein
MTPQPNERVIPVVAWVVAVCIVALVMFVCLGVAMGGSFRGPEFVIFFFVSCFLAGYAVLVGYVYGDAKRRGMRHVLWTWIAILVPNGLGPILYFILREPLMVYCSHCGYRCKPGFAYCPSCGGGLAPTCPNCKKIVQPGWPHCAYCGTSLTSPRTSPSPPATGSIPGTA